MRIVNQVTFSNWHELGLVFIVAAITQILMMLVNLNTNAIDNWRDWAIAAGVGILQAGARAALAFMVASKATGQAS